MTASKSHPPSRRDVVSAGGATLAVAIELACDRQVVTG